MNATLYYIHDPMCSWCWGFRKTWDTVQNQLSGNVTVKYLLGGLAPDSDKPMPDDMQINIRDTWRTIEKNIPGTKFNFDFWTTCKPRRSTYPACRAVIAARKHKKEHEMLFAIQHAYYLDAKNPSDDNTLITLASEVGIDKQSFSEDLNSEDNSRKLHEEIQLSRSLGINSYPSLLMADNNQSKTIHIDYNNPDSILSQLND